MFYDLFDFKNPKYSSTDNQNDIGLVRLAQPVRFNDKILPACLSSVNLAKNLAKGFVAAWVCS